LKIIRKRFNDWNSKKKNCLKYATFENGFMRRAMKAFPACQTIVVFSKKQVMGWALAFKHGQIVTVNIFVNKRYRRRGLATMLIEEMLKDFKVISLGEWNKATRKFFRALRDIHIRSIIVFDWWEKMHEYDQLIIKQEDVS